MNDRQSAGDQGPSRARLLGFLLPRFDRAPALGYRGQRLYRHREKGVGDNQRNNADRRPKKAVVEKDSGPGKKLGVLLEHRPIAGDAVHQPQTDRVKNGRPKVLEGAGCRENCGGHQIRHEHCDALQVDDEYFPAERGHAKKQRAEEENLNDGDGEERLQVPPRVAAGDSGVVGPGSQRPRGFPENQPAEGEDGGDKGAGPTPTEVGKLRNRLGEDDLVGVSLEVPEDRRPENCSDDEDPKQAEDCLEDGRRVRSIEKDFVIADVDEILGGDGKEAQEKPEREIDVSRQALQSKLELKEEEFPELTHWSWLPVPLG